MEIRKLDEDDVDIWRKIRLESLEIDTESFGSCYEEEVIYSESEWKKELKEDSVFGAFETGMLVGVVRFHRFTIVKERHRGALYAMYVMPKYRGRGIANSLVKVAIEHARSCVLTLRLGCATNKIAAIELYKKNGFKIFGTEAKYLRIGDQFFDVHFMALDLCEDAK